MDIRNVQKTGDMYYVYLPTKWARRNNISAKSKVGLQTQPDGSLSISPSLDEKKLSHLKLQLQEESPDIINRVLIACYINPTSSFKITMKKEMDFKKVLDQTRLFSLEVVELDGNHISCESSISVSDPASLLKTMIRKASNLIQVMIKKLDPFLIERYEEEIDKSRLLIEKSVIHSLMIGEMGGLQPVDLHYISMISRAVERMVDHLISLQKATPGFLKSISEITNELHALLSHEQKTTRFLKAVQFLKKVTSLEDVKVKDVETYDRRRIVRSLVNISEIIIDWTITKEINI